jgi:hypothetical protein
LHRVFLGDELFDLVFFGDWYNDLGHEVEDFSTEGRDGGTKWRRGVQWCVDELIPVSCLVFFIRGETLA